MPLTIVVRARTEAGDALGFKNGALQVPTEGDSGTIVVLSVTPTSKPRVHLAVPIVEFEGCRIDNPNGRTGFPSGDRNDLPALMFYSKVNTDKLGPNDVNNFVGAGTMLGLRASWYMDQHVSHAPQIQWRGGAAPRTDDALACFDATDGVPTVVHKAERGNLKHMLSYTLHVPVQCAHHTAADSGGLKRRRMLNELDGVVPVCGAAKGVNSVAQLRVRGVPQQVNASRAGAQSDVVFCC